MSISEAFIESPIETHGLRIEQARAELRLLQLTDLLAEAVGTRLTLRLRASQSLLHLQPLTVTAGWVQGVNDAGRLVLVPRAAIVSVALPESLELGDARPNRQRIQPSLTMLLDDLVRRCIRVVIRCADERHSGRILQVGADVLWFESSDRRTGRQRLVSLDALDMVELLDR